MWVTPNVCHITISASSMLALPSPIHSEAPKTVRQRSAARAALLARDGRRGLCVGDTAWQQGMLSYLTYALQPPPRHNLSGSVVAMQWPPRWKQLQSDSQVKTTCTVCRARPALFYTGLPLLGQHFECLMTEVLIAVRLITARESRTDHAVVSAFSAANSRRRGDCARLKTPCSAYGC